MDLKSQGQNVGPENHIKALNIFASFGFPSGIGCEMETSSAAASTPTQESPVGPGELSRGKNLFPSSVTKIRKPLFFSINWNIINACLGMCWCHGHRSAHPTMSMSMSMSVCAVCRNKGMVLVQRRSWCAGQSLLYSDALPQF